MNKLILLVSILSLIANLYLVKLARYDYVRAIKLAWEFECKIAQRVGAFGCDPQIYNRDDK
jgi:hypothetical protein